MLRSTFAAVAYEVAEKRAENEQVAENEQTQQSIGQAATTVIDRVMGGLKEIAEHSEHRSQQQHLWQQQVLQQLDEIKQRLPPQ